MAVLGDVGGHLAALRAELTRLGVPDGGDGPIPADLTVVQVGDLVLGKPYGSLPGANGYTPFFYGNCFVIHIYRLFDCSTCLFFLAPG